jgi:hypothetical protein
MTHGISGQDDFQRHLALMGGADYKSDKSVTGRTSISFESGKGNYKDN